MHRESQLARSPYVNQTRWWRGRYAASSHASPTSYSYPAPDSRGGSVLNWVSNAPLLLASSTEVEVGLLYWPYIASVKPLKRCFAAVARANPTRAAVSRVRLVPLLIVGFPQPGVGVTL